MTHNVAVIGHVALTLFPGMKLCCLVTRAETISETGLWLTHTHTHSSQSGVCYVTRLKIRPRHTEMWSKVLLLRRSAVCVFPLISGFARMFYFFFPFHSRWTALHSAPLSCLCFSLSSLLLSLALVVSPRLFFFLLIRWRRFLFLMQLGSMAALILCNHTGGGDYNQS